MPAVCYVRRQLNNGLWEFSGLTPYVGATLVVALDWAGTRPVPLLADAPGIPKEPK